MELERHAQMLMLRKVWLTSALLGASVGASAQGLGTWQTNPGPWSVFAIHMTLLPDSSLLIMNRGRFPPFFPTAHRTPFKLAIVKPPYTTSEEIPFWDPTEHTPHELFCSGHVLLEDGTVFFAGGHLFDNVGTYDTTTYNPVTREFVLRSAMRERRWYPTCLNLPNRRVLIVSGTYTDMSGVDKRNPFVEVWMNELGTARTGTYVTDVPSAQRRTDRYYPFAFIDPTDGNPVVLASGIPEDSDGIYPYAVEPNMKLDLDTWTWRPYATLQASVQNIRLDYPSAVMIDGLIIRSGGSKLGVNSGPAYHASRQVLTCNLRSFNPNAAWTIAPQMVLGRKNHTLTALPDGRVLAMGGNLYHQYGQIGGPETNDFTDNERSAPEIWDPSRPNEPWRLLRKPSPDIGRGYHSTALLLPDARVIVGGGEYEFQQAMVGQPLITNQKRTAQIFSPPYGGLDNWQQTRPMIMKSSTTRVLSYGEDFVVRIKKQANRSISKVSLIGLGSTTHGYNMNQTVVFLNKTTLPINSNTLRLTAPDSTREAAPGYYMMFVVDSAGIPSVAEIVQLKDWQRSSPISVDFKGSTTTTRNDEVALYCGDNKYLGGSDGLSAGLSTQLAVETEVLVPATDLKQMRIDIESRTTLPCALDVEAWNFTTNSWEALGSEVTQLTDKTQRIEFSKTDDLSQETASGSNHLVRLRLKYTSFVTNFKVFLDLVEVAYK